VRALLTRLLSLYPRRGVALLAPYYPIINAHASIDASLSSILDIFTSSSFASPNQLIQSHDVDNAGIRSLYHIDRRSHFHTSLYHHPIAVSLFISLI
jgi:hypothetical protein